MLQVNLAALKAYVDDSYSTDAPCMKASDITAAMQHTLPLQVDAMEQFCFFLRNVAIYAGEPGCAAISEAGALPVLFNALSYWLGG